MVSWRAVRTRRSSQKISDRIFYMHLHILLLRLTTCQVLSIEKSRENGRMPGLWRKPHRPPPAGVTFAKTPRTQGGSIAHRVVRVADRRRAGVGRAGADVGRSTESNGDPRDRSQCHTHEVGRRGGDHRISMCRVALVNRDWRDRAAQSAPTAWAWTGRLQMRARDRVRGPID